MIVNFIGSQFYIAKTGHLRCCLYTLSISVFLCLSPCVCLRVVMWCCVGSCCSFDRVCECIFSFVDVLRNNKPCVVVLQIISLSGIRFFIFDNVKHVVLSSFGWSFCSPLSLCRHPKPQIPLSGFSDPSVWALGGDPQGSPPLLSVMLYVSIFHQLLSRFFEVLNSDFLTPLRGLMCFPSLVLVARIVCHGCKAVFEVIVSVD